MTKVMLKNWLKKAIAQTVISAISGLSATLLMMSPTLTADAFQAIDLTTNANITGVQQGIAGEQLQLTDITYDNGILEFCINTDAYLTVGIYESTNSGNKTVKTLSNSALMDGICYSYYWNGEDEDGNDVDSDADIFYWIKAVNKLTDKDSVSATSWIQYDGEKIDTDDTDDDANDDDADTNENLIKNLELNEDKFDPYDNEKAEISFELTEDAEEVDVKIYTKSTNELIATLEDSEELDEDEYTYIWNGKDADGETVNDGTYKIKVKAETGDHEEDLDTIEVKVKEGSSDETTDPRIENVFATKDSFDPKAGEKTYIVFTTTADADVKVKIYDEDDKEVDSLYNKKDLEAGTYALAWDEEDIAYDETYTYEITAKNDDETDTETGEIRVEEDEEVSKKANVYKDRTSPVVFDPNQDDEIAFEFKLSKDAQVTLIVYEDGEKITTIADDKELEKGSNTIYWNGGTLGDGVYEYKIFAKTDNGESKEFGEFMIQKSGKKSQTEGKCAGFTDVSDNHVYCEAITWAKNAGIFAGYNDGTFKPYQVINRAEALKTVLVALKFEIMPYNGENLGFSDIGNGSWYMSYIKTGKAYGVISGYADGTFRPGKQIVKAEALVMLLNAANIKNGLTLQSCGYKPYGDVEVGTWYTNAVCYAKTYELTQDYGTYFYPTDEFVRGDMAKLLYNFYKAGLLN
ncbi:MAG: S-layer homology domain-containing protein [Candidatus Gracilibacteria bacterium]